MIKTTSNGERNMSTVKHSKYKNTGILFELLVRQVASATLSSENSEAVRIIKEYFSNKNQLGKELQLYQTILKERFNSENQANRFLDAVLSSRKKLSQSKLRREKYNLIKEIKEHYDIEKFTKATGIKKVVTKVTKAAGVKDCGCNDRRDTLNRVFPYKR